jgi:hypothetical protein
MTTLDATRESETNPNQVEPNHGTSQPTSPADFFVFFIFLEMNPIKTYFQYLILSIHVHLVDTTHEEVTQYALARPMRLTRARRTTLTSVVPCRSSRAMSVDATPS